MQYASDLKEEKEGRTRGKRGGKTGDARRRAREEKDEEELGGRKSGRKTQQDQGADIWKSAKDAIAGIPQHEIDSHKSTAGRSGCWRCGNESHRTFKCYAKKTKAGTILPLVPTKGASATTSAKRKRDEEEEVKEESPAPKQQKIAAVQEIDEDMREAAIWAQRSKSEEEDGTAAFLARYTAAISNMQLETISAAYPTRQEWEEQLAKKEGILCIYCGYGHEICECEEEL